MDLGGGKVGEVLKLAHRQGPAELELPLSNWSITVDEQDSESEPAPIIVREVERDPRAASPASSKYRCRGGEKIAEI